MMDREELIKAMELLVENYDDSLARELLIKSIAQLKAASERIAELESEETDLRGACINLRERIIDLGDAISLRELPSVQVMEARIAELEKSEKVESVFTTSKVKLISVQKENIDCLTKQNKILDRGLEEIRILHSQYGVYESDCVDYRKAVVRAVDAIQARQAAQELSDG